MIDPVLLFCSSCHWFDDAIVAPCGDIDDTQGKFAIVCLVFFILIR
jgi:hypothetical protein